MKLIIGDYLKQNTDQKSYINSAIADFVNLEPVNKTRFAEVSGIINNLVDGLDQSDVMVDKLAVGPGVTVYSTIEKLAEESKDFQEVNKRFLHEIRYSKSKTITKKVNRDQLTDFVKKVYDARVEWYKIKDAVNAHREEFKKKIITKESKPKKPVTLKDFVPIYKIPASVVEQLEKIESELYQKFYDQNVEWLNDLIVRYDNKSITESSYRNMSLDFRGILKFKDGILKAIENKDEVIKAKAKLYARGTTDFIVCRMFSKIKNINFQMNPVFMYNIEDAGSHHFTIRIGRIRKSDAILRLEFSMIINRSIYNKLFNQFPTKLFLIENGKTTQITDF